MIKNVFLTPVVDKLAKVLILPNVSGLFYLVTVKEKPQEKQKHQKTK